MKDSWELITNLAESNLPFSKYMAKKLPTVFITYSPEDKPEMEMLLTQLKILERDVQITIWVDDNIPAGSNKKTEIKKAIESADVAILLITANFLVSEFILNDKLPAILERRTEEGLIVYPIIGKYCAWDQISWLEDMHIRPPNGDPIWRDGGVNADKELTKIVHEVLAILQSNNMNSLKSQSWKVSKQEDKTKSSTTIINPGPNSEMANDKNTFVYDEKTIIVTNTFKQKTVLIIALHGSNSRGGWISQFTPSVLGYKSDKNLIPYPFDYGTIFNQLYSRMARHQKVTKTFSHLEQIIHSYKQEFDLEVCVLAHSFGTVILGELLKRMPSAYFDRVLLVDSLLPSNFRWDSISGHFNIMLNSVEESQKRSPFINNLFGLNRAGKVGFQTDHPKIHQLAFPFNTRSELLNPQLMRKIWLSFLVDGKIPDHDDL